MYGDEAELLLFEELSRLFLARSFAPSIEDAINIIPSLSPYFYYLY